MILKWNAEENLVVNNKTMECLSLGTTSLIVSPWKFDILKTSIFALKALLLWEILL